MSEWCIKCGKWAWMSDPLKIGIIRVDEKLKEKYGKFDGKPVHLCSECEK